MTNTSKSDIQKNIVYQEAWNIHINQSNFNTYILIKKDIQKKRQEKNPHITVFKIHKPKDRQHDEQQKEGNRTNNDSQNNKLQIEQHKHH